MCYVVSSASRKMKDLAHNEGKFHLSLRHKFVRFVSHVVLIKNERNIFHSSCFC